MRAKYGFTVCVLDDDTRTFELRFVSDTSDVMGRVAAAVKSSRKVRCYILAEVATARKDEEKDLTSRGYRLGTVLI
jgi:hypothetical protein